MTLWATWLALKWLGSIIYDFQTLIAGAGAIAAAYYAARPVWRQLELTQTQANGVLREMLLHRQSEISQARTAVAEQVGKYLNALAFTLDPEGEEKITEHEAHNHDLGVSHAISWLRRKYHWRDGSRVEAAKETLIRKLDALLSILSDVHAPAHTDQSGEDYSMTDEEWAAFQARGEAAKDEVPGALADAQTAHREMLTELDAEAVAITRRLTAVNEALLSH